MLFSGENFATLNATNILSVRRVPDLVSDLTISAVVRQDSGNDGYLVGKGLNDRMRDFGLYLRSSKSTVWLAYGSDDKGYGFRDIIFFYNINVADGNEHSVTAVIDSSANSASLYIDGVLRGHQSPLPATPAFRPDVSDAHYTSSHIEMLCEAFLLLTYNLLIVCVMIVPFIVHSCIATYDLYSFLYCIEILVV